MATIQSVSRSPPLKVAVIGAGLIGPRHAQSVISNPSTELVALVEPSPNGSSIAASLKTTHYASITDLLTSPHKPDVAIICTPNHTHVPLSLELISAGIHILVEKPISTTLSSGLSLISAAKAQDIQLLVGHHRRFNPYLLSTKQGLSSNTLGKIIAVQGTWCLLKPASYFEGIGSWRQSSESGETTKSRRFDAEEGAAILMRFKSGVVGTFILSDAVPSPWNFETGTGENPNIPKVEGVDGFYRIMGTKGSLSVPDLTRWSYEEGATGKVGWNQSLKKEQLKVEEEKVPFDFQVQHFVDVVRDGKEPSCTGEEALRALVVCEAVKKAMKCGLPVEIDGFEIRERGKV
ncbi:hypothetical protein G7Y89_g2107 [Cudoniella acicularis]|uniref:Gfo/Idh/MocA-like oxidoreductase N-terminal domain-containing protein n=1 Tax=Cudoniella acicularis TaxID=354080 RepID=A0A8H4RWW3_9HELO|nr:hypothetical protein G7Y89_g2107 [Cudoniella acicularis]